MKQELQNYVVQCIEWLKTSASWLSDEIPVYVNELLKYHLVVSWIWAIVFSILVIIFIFLIVLCIKANDNFIISSDMGGIIFLSCCAIGSISGMIYFISDIVKISIAPRVWLIDYLMDMLK